MKYIKVFDVDNEANFSVWQINPEEYKCRCIFDFEERNLDWEWLLTEETTETPEKVIKGEINYWNKSGGLFKAEEIPRKNAIIYLI